MPDVSGAILRIGLDLSQNEASAINILTNTDTSHSAVGIFKDPDGQYALDVSGVIKCSALEIDNDVINVVYPSNISHDVNGGLTVRDLTDLNGGLDVSGDVSFNNNLTVEGLTDLNGGLDVSGDVSFTNNLTVTGLTDLNGRLDVAGDVSFTNNAHIANVSIIGDGTYARIGHKNMVDATVAVNQGPNGDTYIQCGNGQDLQIRENGGAHVIVKSGGKVGIGTESPYAALHVDGDDGSTVGGYTPGTRRLVQPASSGQLQNDTPNNEPTVGSIDILAENRIMSNVSFVVTSGGTLTGSDERIKTNIRDLQDSECLEQLKQLKPKRYNYKDVFARGEDSVVGFIAQQVLEVLPCAVELSPLCIPNIYQAAIFNEGVLEFASSIEFSAITDGGKIRVFDISDKVHYLEVESVTPTTITLADATQITEDMLYENKIFVYGAEVPDFHLLKKEMIIPITVGAIQEVDRQLTAEKAKTAALETEITDIKARLAALESA